MYPAPKKEPLGRAVQAQFNPRRQARRITGLSRRQFLKAQKRFNRLEKARTNG